MWQKGLAFRFLRIFPKPVINNFASLNINQNAECETDTEQFKELIGNNSFVLLKCIINICNDKKFP